MIHLSPVTEATTNPQIKTIYNDIKSVLNFDTLPAYFTYLANSPDLLSIIWNKLKPICSDPKFNQDVESLASLINNQAIPINDPKINLLVTKISQQDRLQMEKEFKSLETQNCKILMISILIRESLKAIGFEKDLTKLKETNSSAEDNSNLSSALDVDNDQKGLNTASQDSHLQTVFEQNPYFITYFQLMSVWLENFSHTQDYVVLRVFLEKQTQELIKYWLRQIHFDYYHIINAIKNHPYPLEIIYLCFEAFPAYYPKQFIFSVFLRKGLQFQSNLYKVATILQLQQAKG